MIEPRKWLPLFAAGAIMSTAVIIGSPTGASQPYSPTLEFVSISNSAPGANANVTVRSSLPAGQHLLGSYGLELPAWTIAGDAGVPDGHVTVVATMAVNFEPDGNCNDGDSGTPQTYGPFPLRDEDAGGGQGPHAQWGGIITDFSDGDPNTSWFLTFVIEPDVTSGFTIDGIMTDALLPTGSTVCTPQTLTLTFCGRANPTQTPVVCGSGTNPVVMTNPPTPACYTWALVTTDESGQHSANAQAGISIGGAPCATPTPTQSPSPTPSPSPSPTPSPTPPPADGDGDGVLDANDNCPRWPNPSQNLPPWPVLANDPDCDGFSSAVENSAGANALVHCGADAWPADITNNTFSDTGDIGALTGNFGASVPPAPPRHNIAPDPVDGFIDTGDIGRMTAFFGLGCTPCSGDLDCDAVANAIDNCPNWPNRAQGLPPWSVPASDPDCDGFSSAVENSTGTNPLMPCGHAAWPADITNNTFSDTGDIGLVTNDFGTSVPPAPARHNLAPDPPDTFIDTGDIARLTAFFGLSCS